MTAATGQPHSLLRGGQSDKEEVAMEAIANAAGVWPYGSNTCLVNAPGIKIVTPSTPADAKGLLASAIRDDGPVIIFHHRQLLPMTGEIPEGRHTVPLGKGAVRREGAEA